MIARYMALAMQVQCAAVNKCKDRDSAHDLMSKTIDQLGVQIFTSKKFIGPDLRLVVLPEYFLSGFPMRESIVQWRNKVAISQDDPLFEKLGKICRENKIYLSGNYYESDENFPNIFFQASFIMNDEGKLILNYRRLNSMYSPTPHDVYDLYIEKYGYESLFPVVDTPLGRLACVASEEILYPEVTRCLMMNGAEVICHSSSEIGSPIFTKKKVCRQARAIENICWVVSANSAGIADIGIPTNSTDGGSAILSYEGHVLSEALPGESIVAHSWIDVEAQRHYRRTVSMKNYIARQRFELYAEAYASHHHYPVNAIGEETFDKKQFNELQKETIDRLIKNNII